MKYDKRKRRLKARQVDYDRLIEKMSEKQAQAYTRPGSYNK